MRRLIASLLVLGALGACSMSRHLERRSNLMTYLYPDRLEAPRPHPDVRLRLPLRIGIAFVPPEPVHGRYSSDFRSVFPPDSEARLLSIVKKAFQGRDWVGDIMIVPSSYLTPRGGFEDLGQIARLMNVDV